ncbi:unnamed protein product [Ectocarpus sp. 12 AP-2014]
MAGADVNCVDAVDRCSPLHVAVVGGHTQLVADLLMGGAWTNVYNRQGDTPLHVAAKFAGHGRIVTALLVSGADKGARNREGRLPLHLAAEYGHLDGTLAFLAAGVDTSVRSIESNSRSALDIAIESGHSAVVEALIQHGDKDDRPDVNACSERGTTPLHRAAAFDNSGIIDVLVRAGADLEGGDVGGTPIHQAVRGACCNAFHALLRHGANIHARLNGDTLLSTVCASLPEHAPEMVDILLRLGFRETDLDSQGKTAADRVNWRFIFDPLLSQEMVQRVLELLTHAPQDRAWRRRSWLVLMRARVEKMSMKQLPSNGVNGSIAKRCSWGDGVHANNSSGKATHEKKSVLSGLVERLVGLEADAVFRAVLSFV